MTRITDKHLAGLVDRINRLTNNPETYATRAPDGSFTINVGNYHISSAYGGNQLVQTVTSGGGVRDVLSIGFVTKRALYDFMRSYICGLEASGERAQ